MKTKKIIFLFILLISISTNAQSPYPDLILEDINGNSRTLKEITHGEPTIVLFIASWCGPCIKELNSIEDYFNNKHQKKIYIALNEKNKSRAISFFIKGKEIAPNELYFNNSYRSISFFIYIIANNHEVWSHRYSWDDVDSFLPEMENEYNKYDKFTKISFISNELYAKINSRRQKVIQELIQNIPPKDEFEKQKTYTERYNNEKSKIEKSNSLASYFQNYFAKNFEFKIVNTNYDIENSILQVELKDAEPFYVRNFSSSANVNNSNTYLYNLDISIINENKFKINSGTLLFNERKYPISSAVNSFLDNSEKEKIANSYLRKEQSRVFVPKIEYANISNLNNTIVFNGKNFMKEYKSRKNKSIENWKRKKNVTIKSSEKLADYRSRISLNYVDEYDYDIIYDILKDFYPDFDFFKFTKKQYDAENEFFTIYYGNYGKIILPVPIDEAKYFSKALDNKEVKIKDIEFKFIDDNSIALTYIEIVYNANGYYNKLKNKE